MFQFTHLHLAISDKLGWGDMLAKIALPAIQQILENAAKRCSAQIEEPVGYELLKDDILAMSADDIFSLLCPDELSSILCVSGLDPRYPYRMFIGLRGEIEDYMRHGDDYQTAINEWFK